MLDPYTKWYVETMFGCPMYNVYGSCESGANIAFECTEHNWHIHSDFFHIEAIDKNNQLVAPGERGRIVVTRLWTGATPIIRYTGMEDWVTLSAERTCGCGLHSPIFEKPVEGRILSNIILPDGTIYPPGRFLFITDVLIRLKTFKVHRYQIVQNSPEDIEILLSFDPELRTLGPSITELSDKIKKEYAQHIGTSVKITVREVDEIPDDPASGKPAPLVVSKLSSMTSCQAG